MVSGALPRERLQIADYLGHPAATLALGRERSAGDDPQAPNPSLEFWGRRLGKHGVIVMFRAAVALARHLSRRPASAGGPSVAEAPETAEAIAAGLSVADRFCAGTVVPQDEAEAAAKAVARAALSLERESVERRACQTLLPALRAILDVLGGEPAGRGLIDPHYLRALEQAEASGVSTPELLDAVRAELIPWALSPPPASDP